MSKVIGIDLGTTNSCFAIMDGKTAKVIENANRPALILAPNKTLAAQLYGEFKSFFLLAILWCLPHS